MHCDILQELGLLSIIFEEQALKHQGSWGVALNIYFTFCIIYYSTDLCGGPVGGNLWLQSRRPSSDSLPGHRS